jgi:hypothetical protein
LKNWIEYLKWPGLAEPRLVPNMMLPWDWCWFLRKHLEKADHSNMYPRINL